MARELGWMGVLGSDTLLYVSICAGQVTLGLLPAAWRACSRDSARQFAGLVGKNGDLRVTAYWKTTSGWHGLGFFALGVTPRRNKAMIA